LKPWRKKVDAILHMDRPCTPKNSVNSLVVLITIETCGRVEHMFWNP
jgi:hypothetical protein